MANDGKVKRVLREAVEILVEELGRGEAADLLETAAAQLRGVATAQSRQAAAARKRARSRGKSVVG